MSTLVVNLMGGPGCGKSTLTAAIFAKLKFIGINCEMASEFAKELVWEQRHETFKDETYIFAKQAHRLFRLNQKVDVVITDRPLILTLYYAKDDKALCDFSLNRFNQYTNKNYLLTRKKVYNPAGRNQTEDEAKEIDKQLKDILINNNIAFTELPGVEETADIIVKDILTILNKEWLYNE